jgi:hypothetical protein
VGNWDGVTTAPGATGRDGTGDTLTVVRGNRFFVRNALTTGVADHTLLFGDPEDELLVGDWVPLTDEGDGTVTVDSADGADQLAVRRGNTHHLSSEPADARARAANPATERVFDYGEPDDAVFVSSLPTFLDAEGAVVADPDRAVAVIEGDGLGVRRAR